MRRSDNDTVWSLSLLLSGCLFLGVVYLLPNSISPSEYRLIVIVSLAAIIGGSAWLLWHTLDRT